MMKWITVLSVNPRGRLTGIVYLLFFLSAFVGEYMHGRKLTLYDDIANTISYAWYLVLTLLFYFIFKPVNRHLSLIAALFSFVGCIIGVVTLFGTAPFNVSPLVFFAPYCLLIGILIFRSDFLPHFLGVLMVLAGLGWLVFLSPMGHFLTFYIELLGVIAEASLMLWLIVKGVNVQRWNEQSVRQNYN